MLPAKGVTPKSGICGGMETEQKGEGNFPPKMIKGSPQITTEPTKLTKYWVCLNTPGKDFPVLWKFGWNSDQYREKLNKIQID